MLCAACRFDGKLNLDDMAPLALTDTIDSSSCPSKRQSGESDCSQSFVSHNESASIVSASKDEADDNNCHRDLATTRDGILSADSSFGKGERFFL